MAREYHLPLLPRVYLRRRSHLDSREVHISPIIPHLVEVLPPLYLHYPLRLHNPTNQVILVPPREHHQLLPPILQSRQYHTRVPTPSLVPHYRTARLVVVLVQVVHNHHIHLSSRQ